MQGNGIPAVWAEPSFTWNFCFQGAAAGVPAEQDGAAAGGAEAEGAERGLLEGQGDSGGLCFGRFQLHKGHRKVGKDLLRCHM